MTEETKTEVGNDLAKLDEIYANADDAYEAELTAYEAMSEHDGEYVNASLRLTHLRDALDALSNAIDALHAASCD